ncbi:MAG: PD-(D/E)XK nuclease family protein [Firmicutes bacterium]|nr:PD-(D/E)XK nuclease family protein [Bacillota bacterium]
MGGYMYICGNENVMRQRVREVWQGPAVPGPAGGGGGNRDGGNRDGGNRDGGNRDGGIPQVYLLRHWVERILVEMGSTRPAVSAVTRQVLLQEACRSLEGELQYLKGMSRFSGFIRSMGNFIAELKEAGATSEQFTGIVGGGSWRRKDREVARIFEEYQRALAAGGVFDAQDLIWEVVRLLQGAGGGNSSGLNDLCASSGLAGVQTIVFEGFARFSPAEKALINVLRSAGIEVLAGTEPSGAPATGSQAPATGSEAPATRSEAPATRSEASATRSEAPATGSEAPATGSEAPATGSETPAIPTGRQVRLIKAARPEDEARWAAKEIKRLLGSGQVSQPDRIAVVYRNPAGYLVPLKAALAAEGVRVGARSRVRLAEIPVIRLVVRLFDAAVEAADPGEAGELIDLLTSDYLSGFSGMDPDTLREAVARFRSNRPVSEWSAELESPGATSRNVARAREAVLRLHDLLASLAAPGTVEEHRHRLLAVLEELGVEEALFGGYAVASASGEELGALALELRGLQRLVSLLEEMERGYFLAGAAGRKIHFAEYIGVVRSLAEDLTLGERAPDGSGAGVEILPADQLSGCEFEAVFILGLVEGSFPGAGGFDWLYGEEERRRLNRGGVPVPDRTMLDAGEEVLFRAATGAASRFLYLSHPVESEAGRANLPSRFLEEGEAANGRPAPEVAGAGPVVQTSWDQVTTVEELARMTFLHHDLLSPVIRSRLLARLGSSGYPVEDVERRMQIEKLREGREFSPWDGVLGGVNRFGRSDGLDRFDGSGGPDGFDGVGAVAARFGPGAILGVSDIQDYGQCPMRFFFRKVLGLRPPEEALMEAPPATEGSIIHQALFDFYRPHLGAPLDPVRAGEYHREMDEILARIFHGAAGTNESSAGGGGDPAGTHPVLWNLQQERIRVLLHRLLDADLEVVEKTGGRMAPRFLELRFGPARPGEVADPRSGDSPLAIRGVLIAGKIDRIDCPVNGGEGRSGEGRSTGGGSGEDGPDEGAPRQGGPGEGGPGEGGPFVVYDYKLSKGANPKEMLSGADLQIPLYVRAIREFFLRDQEPAGGAYYSIRGARRDGVWRGDRQDLTGMSSRSGVQVDAQAWNALLSRAEEETARRVSGMRNGWFPCKPLDDGNCRSCDYRDICRYDAHRIRGKLTPPGFAIPGAQAPGAAGEGGARDAG